VRTVGGYSSPVPRRSASRSTEPKQLVLTCSRVHLEGVDPSIKVADCFAVDLGSTVGDHREVVQRGLEPLQPRCDQPTADGDDRQNEDRHSRRRTILTRRGSGMTYFELRDVEQLFRRYRQLAVDYWAAVEPTNYSWMAGADAPRYKDTDVSRPLRTQLELLRYIFGTTEGALWFSASVMIGTIGNLAGYGEVVGLAAISFLIAWTMLLQTSMDRDRWARHPVTLKTHLVTAPHAGVCTNATLHARSINAPRPTR
jgi:hypothetical protein